MTAHTPLNVTQKSKHRIFVGLGWNPNESPTLKDKVGALIGKRDQHHDLDLTCYYYNRDNAYLGHVGIDPEHSSNKSGSIYHSGDSVEGVGDGDDEQISVELINLPPNIHHLIFKASIKSGHSFNEVAAPEIRLCDGYTERCFAEAALDDGERDAYVFARVYRGETEGEWLLHEIREFIASSSAKPWEDTLSRYL